MVYENILKNAHGVVNLHDCEIKKLSYENKNFHVYFPDGFFLDGETRSAKNAEIIIKDLCAEDADFIVSKPYRFIKGRLPFYITKYKSIKDLKKMFGKGYHFTILKEYYENGEILWKGVIESEKNHKIKNHGNFELTFYSDNLEYCFNISDESDN